MQGKRGKRRGNKDICSTRAKFLVKSSAQILKRKEEKEGNVEGKQGGNLNDSVCEQSFEKL